MKKFYKIPLYAITDIKQPMKKIDNVIASYNILTAKELLTEEKIAWFCKEYLENRLYIYQEIIKEHIKKYGVYTLVLKDDFIEKNIATQTDIKNYIDNFENTNVKKVIDNLNNSPKKSPEQK